MTSAPNLVLVGPMGAGKTSLGRQLAPRLGLEFVDADARLEEIAGAAVTMIFELEGEAGFRAREERLLLELLQGEGRLIATGGGAVLSAATRAALAQRAHVVWLKVDIDRQLDRLARDHSRPLLAQGDRRETLEALARVRDPLYAEVADLEFAVDGRDAAGAARRLARQLGDDWTRAA